MEAQRAQELDPLSVIIHFVSGLSFYHAGRFDRAIEQFQKGLEIDDGFYWALHFMALRRQRWRLYYERRVKTVTLDVNRLHTLKYAY